MKCDKCKREFIKLRDNDYQAIILEIDIHSFKSVDGFKGYKELEELNKQIKDKIKILPLYGGGLTSNCEKEVAILFPKGCIINGISFIKKEVVNNETIP